jgi:protein involved in polysaccharide export with SLBB domain
VPIEASISNAYVRVSGAVKQSGVFKLNRGETLRALVARLGGVTDNAYVYATELDRESVRRLQQAKLNEVAARFARDLETGAAQQAASTSDSGNIAILAASVERQRSIAQRMASVKAKGRIVLEMQDGTAELKNLPDIPLRDGDSVFIPNRPDTVDVLGAVFQQNTFIYRPSRNVGDYVALAGGASQTADPSQMYVIRADGTTSSRGNNGWFSGLNGTRINPGDTIVVPEEIAHTSWTQGLKEWTSIFYQFGLGAAGLKVLKD